MDFRDGAAVLFARGRSFLRTGTTIRSALGHRIGWHRAWLDQIGAEVTGLSAGRAIVPMRVQEI
jgi:hypothetical protein